MDIDSLPEGVRAAARQLRDGYDMKNHAVGSGAHAQALDAEFIHRFGIAGPADEAKRRFSELEEAGVGYLRIVPGSRDMPREVAGASFQALGKIVAERKSA